MLKEFAIRIGAFFRRLFRKRISLDDYGKKVGMSFDAKLYMTCHDEPQKVLDVRFKADIDAEMDLIKVYPDHPKQKILGFGAAFTDAAASVYAQMDAGMKLDFMQMCFGEEGNAYSFCRTPIMSCDFSRKPYSYVDKGDRSLESFSIAPDEEILIPMIKDAQAVNPDIEWLASPWSPPAFMKTNGIRKFGGHLKPECYTSWAEMIVRYIEAYAKQGIKIARITMQNEPNARQIWESCLMNAKEESTFAEDYVKPSLVKAGLEEVEVLVWDHNKDQIVERSEAELSSGPATDSIDGIAFHWYSGDHFEALREEVDRFPDKEFIMTEGCVEFTDEWKDETAKAEKYVHDIIGDLEAGANAYIDWNIVLDEIGGPNHVKNYCDAPIIYQRGEKKLVRKKMFDYIGHVSHFIKPGATRVLTSRCTTDLETVTAINVDGSHVMVMLNRNYWAIDCNIHENGSTCSFTMPGHSVASLVWNPPQR